MTKRKKEFNSEQLVDSIVKGIQEVKGDEICCIDLRAIPHAVADYFVICTGNSSTQVSAIARSVEIQTEKDFDESAWHIEGRQNSEWILMDYGNVIVHVFHKEARAHYNLEELWGDGEIQRFENRA